jgi:hypothetical protein
MDSSMNGNYSNAPDATKEKNAIARINKKKELTINEQFGIDFRKPFFGL